MVVRPWPDSTSTGTVRIDLAERRERRESVHLAGHDEIEDHRRGRGRLESPYRLVGRLHRLGLVSARAREAIRNSHIAGSSSTTMTRMESGMEFIPARAWPQGTQRDKALQLNG